MGYEWNDDLRTGVADVDSQHKELIRRLNSLLESCIAQKDENAIGTYLDFLREYVAFHFAAEEREMVGHQYPGLAEHVAEHESFKKRVNQLYRSHVERGESIQILVATVRSSGEWLINHIHKTDKAMAADLVKQGNA